MAEDNRTEAQKALGIHPLKAEDKEEDADGQLDKSPESEDEDVESEESSDAPDEAAKEDEDEDEAFTPEDKEEDAPDEDEPESKKTVPLKRLLDEKKKTKELEDRIAKLESKFGEDASKELVGQMAAELKITPEAAAKLLEYSSKSVLMTLEKEGKVITPELKKRLDAFEEGKDEIEQLTAEQKKAKAEQKEIAYFGDEWQDFLPTLKKQYKNATPSMLKEAAQEMYRKARSADYGNVPGKHPAYPLDYIFFREKKAFDTLLRVSPKNGSGPQGHDVEQDDVKIDITDPNLTPQQFQRYKQQQGARKLAEDKARGGIKFI